ncbi:MAG: hypothetical protein CMH88_11355 [Oceanibulbus sp.]|uniref:histidine kinase n=2 Tax=Roseobacteraceae TaxID=2854170 RepID=A0ABY3ZFZ2_9RHOB|nr:hypothetical protein [Sulfitobacter sp.]UOA13486.1 Blue-light-activated histidine kinase [Sulfitobacter dubius]
MLQSTQSVALDASHFELIEAMTDEVVILDATGTIVAANTAWKLFCEENGGDLKSHYVGANYFDICKLAVLDAVVQAEAVLDGLRTALKTGAPFEGEYPCDGPGVRRWFQLNANRMAIRGVPCLLLQHRNVTTRRMAHDDIERAHLQAETFAALVATTGEAILTYDLEGCIISWNPAAERLYGYTEQEALGQSVELLYPRDWPTSVLEYRDQIVAGNLRQFDAVRVAKDGTKRHVTIACTPIRTLSGDIVSISNIHHDVTATRKAEEVRDLVSREVIHRAKNMLSLVTAMQRQTAKSAKSLAEFNKSFGDRIQALARSTDLLVDGGWSSVDLDQLVRAQLDPFLHGQDDVVDVAGPPVSLGPQALQLIGMALHELATNSTKYGVMSDGNGHIFCHWSHTEKGGLHFHWAETGITLDPSLKKTTGFGSKVLSVLAPAMVNGSAETVTSENTLTWTVTIPAAHLSSPC